MDTKVIGAVTAAVEAMREELTEALRQLVQIPSVTGDEGRAQRFVHRLYEKAGLGVQVVMPERATLEKHPAFCDSGKPFENRPNVIGTLKGDPRKRSLILNAHVDVVSPEPVGEWIHDPWGGAVEGNRLFGRGALDMKSGLIANLFAVRALLRCGLDPGGTVMLQSVIEEEDGGGGGTLACFLDGYTADGMIVTEPTGFVNVALAGVRRFIVRVYGKPAHPAQSHLGVNAIGKMLPLYEAIQRLDAHRKATVRFPLFEEAGSPAAHLIVGTLRAGDHISTVAGFAEMGGRVGFIPGETDQEIRALIQDTIREAAGRDPWLREHPPVVEWLPILFEPFHQDPEHEFVQTIMTAVKSVVGDRAEVKPRGVTWSEDTRLAQYFGFPAVSFGPVGERPHGVDEYVDLDSVVLLAQSVALSTLAWCSKRPQPHRTAF